MELEELNGTQLFLAGAMLSKIIEELKVLLGQMDNEDADIAMTYILNKINDLNGQIAEESLKQIITNMDRIREIIDEV